MKTLTALLVGVLFVAIALAGSTRHRSIKPKNSKQAQASTDVPHRNWRIGSPVSFDNLTVFPVLSDQAEIGDDFITLDEGLHSGTVIITELGADGRSHRLRSQRRIRDNDDSEVNRLALTNKSGKKLILIAGEMIIGGKQDRIVGHDCILEATAKPVPIDVFCVEHGRWSGSESFGQSRNVSNGSGSSDGPVRAGGDGSRAISARAIAGVMAMPNVREKAQATKSQSEVWNDVAKSVTVNKVSTGTGDLKSVYKDKQVSRKLDDYEHALKGKLATTTVIGVIAAVSGRIVSADAFANHHLFQAYWPKMLRSYALAALSAEDKDQREVTRSEAEAYLTRVEGTAATSGDQDAYRLVENQSTKDASFELESRARRQPLVHFNRVSKQ